MRRLTRRRRDRGAAATWVALLIVPMLVVAALGIDVGMMHVAKQRLQTGADAAALAIATQCARGICTGPTNHLAAQDMATANAPLTGGATATVDVLDLHQGYVEVTTTSTTEHFFGPIAGVDSTQLSATSGARWGYPERGTVDLPIAISYCELAAAVGVNDVNKVFDLAGNIIGVDLPASGIRRTINSASVLATICPGRLLAALTGRVPALAFLTPASSCGAQVIEIRAQVNQSASSTEGVPTTCRARDFSQFVGETVYLPVYAEHTIGLPPLRTNKYRVYAFVAVTVHGFDLGNGVKSSPTFTCPAAPSSLTANRCIDVTFRLDVGIDSPSDDFEYGPDAPPIGDPRVQLVLPEERP